MSKTGAWYLDMCEDAGVLTKDEFIKNMVSIILIFGMK